MQHQGHSIFQTQSIEDAPQIGANGVAIEAQLGGNFFVLFSVKDQADDPGLLRRELQRLNNVLPCIRREEGRKRADGIGNGGLALRDHESPHLRNVTVGDCASKAGFKIALRPDVPLVVSRRVPVLLFCRYWLKRQSI